MVTYFLPRSPNLGWASKAKPIPPEKKDRQRHIKQNRLQTPPGEKRKSVIVKNNATKQSGSTEKARVIRVCRHESRRS